MSELQTLIDVLTKHRDDHYPKWCKERGLLSFAIILARQIEATQDPTRRTHP